MAKYCLKFPDDEDRFEELARISHNLRYYSKIWKENYGSVNRAMMVKWENLMDKWLKENVDYTDLSLLGEKSKAMKDNWAFGDKIYE